MTTRARTKRSSIALACVLLAGGAHAWAEGNATKGQDVFDKECSDCHSVKQGKNKKGPSLFGIVDRASASIVDFNYSDAMRAVNVVWSAEKIDAYITKPKEVVAGTKMKYDGLGNAADRADLLAYLSAQK